MSKGSKKLHPRVLKALKEGLKKNIDPSSLAIKYSVNFNTLVSVGREIGIKVFPVKSVFGVKSSGMTSKEVHKKMFLWSEKKKALEEAKRQEEQKRQALINKKLEAGYAITE